ncbi:MAG: substrate-binding domain-containing protein [Acidobacteria bacterium]|jgi:tungstate transport system substrate-binding protein|nr:substrate-binding domain-containing protein [Acidobacteriota bacterium]
MRTRWLAGLALLACALSESAPAAENVLILATTTSPENSGLLAHIHPDFERQTGIRVKVIAKGTGAAIQYAKDGNADAILVHDRAQEDAFLRDGHGVDRHDVMYNDFVILGPAADPAGIRGQASASRAFARIAAAGSTFVSRGDDSGTHAREQSLWRASGVPQVSESREVVSGGTPRTLTMTRPGGAWYRSIGQGMGKAITYATETQAYLLCDRGTFYAYALGEPPRTDLVVLVEGDPVLDNPYGVIAVNPAKHPGVNYEAATQYIRWLTSAATQQAIADFKVGGKVLFFPARKAVGAR